MHADYVQPPPVLGHTIVGGVQNPPGDGVQLLAGTTLSRNIFDGRHDAREGFLMHLDKTLDILEDESFRLQCMNDADGLESNRAWERSNPHQPYSQSNGQT